MTAIATIAFACAAVAADPNKVLRVAANDIDTLDPQQYNDNPSFEVLIAIFEPLYEWDYLESPPKLSPLTATAPIEITDGGKRWIMRVKPGIFFTDDPAFKGKPREPFQDAIKEMQQGQFQIIFRGFGGSPSGYPELLQLYSKQPRRINAGLFNLPEYDRAAEQFLRSGTAAEQIAAARRMSDLARTYMPMLPAIFRLENDFVQPWLRGFSAPIFSTYWKYLDIDLDRRK